MAGDDVTGAVTNLLSETQLVVSIGSAKGAQEGDHVFLYYPDRVVVIDPSTQEDLGSFQRAKLDVRIVRVFERFSICETYQARTERSRSSIDFSSYAASIFARPPAIPTETTTTIKQTLRADDSTYPRPLEEKDSYVKVGDLAILRRQSK